MLSKVVILVCTPISTGEEYTLLHAFDNIKHWTSIFANLIDLNRSYFGFNFHFPDYQWAWVAFQMNFWSFMLPVFLMCCLFLTDNNLSLTACGMSLEEPASTIWKTWAASKVLELSAFPPLGSATDFPWEASCLLS